MSSFEILFFAILVILQIFSFWFVSKRISDLKNFFPTSFSSLKIGKRGISKEIINDQQKFEKFLSHVSAETDSAESKSFYHNEEVELIELPAWVRNDHKGFSEVVNSTNAYLCKNKGASADFNILQDICDRTLQKLDNGISNLINVPLYIGLGGTFLGIILGLSGIEFSAEGNTLSTEGIEGLLKGVTYAMSASLLGLLFTVISSALMYKPAAYKNDTDKNHYYDFLQRELLPVLNVGMAGSLTTFKSVLAHFVEKFSSNMDDYKDSAALLNNNLHQQQLVLEEINRLSITKTSVEIARVFADLKESSEHLASFREYQQGLNENIKQSEQVLENFKDIIDTFKDFNNDLRSISSNVHSSIELQKQFKDSLEIHFPTTQDAREVWRAHVDELNKDIKGVYEELGAHFRKSTEVINEFVGNNDSFFMGLTNTQDAMKAFVEYARLQNAQFKELKDEIGGMRKEAGETQLATLNMNKELIEAVKQLNKTLARREIAEPKAV